MSDLIKNILLGLLRHSLTYGGGTLVSAGLINGSQEQDMIGAAITIAGIIWSAYEKYQTNKNGIKTDLTGKVAPTVPVVNGGPLPPVQ